MKGIGRLAIFATVLLIGFWWARPWIDQWLDQQMGPLGDGPRPELRCLLVAEKAVEGFSDTLDREFADTLSREFADTLSKEGVPPVRLDRWSVAFETSRARSAWALNRCACEEPACEKANKALTALSKLMDRVDHAVRAGRSPRHVALDLQEIRETLGAAARVSG